MPFLPLRFRKAYNFLYSETIPREIHLLQKKLNKAQRSKQKSSENTSRAKAKQTSNEIAETSARLQLLVTMELQDPNFSIIDPCSASLSPEDGEQDFVKSIYIRVAPSHVSVHT